MDCQVCGIANPPGSNFCSSCGNRLINEAPQVHSAPPPVVPQPPPVIVQTPPVVVQTPSAVQEVKRSWPLVNIIAAAIGAIMMLVSLPLTWYSWTAWSGGEHKATITGIDVMSSVDSWTGLEKLPWALAFADNEPLWVGRVLPVILIIVFASIVLLSVVYSLFSRKETKALWALLGLVSVVCVVGNAVYLMWILTQTWQEYPFSNILYTGSIVALVGALVLLFSGIVGRSER